MKTCESREDYLEAILILGNRNGYVRSVDVAKFLNYSKPSVSVAMSNLRKAELVENDEEGQLCLTEKGRELAEGVYERHRLLRAFFISIGVDEQTAAEDACRVEHVISETTFQKLCEHAGAMNG